MTYLSNTWYVAAWSSEVADQPMSRTILDQQLVLYRTADGRACVASNLCPHRFAPLSMGQVVGNTIECPYHGLRFNEDGRCTYNPDSDGRIPSGARLRTFPVEERWGAVWIWPGDVERADPALIPTYNFLDDVDHWRPVTGLLHVRANYRHINDNIMDQAHLHMVHHNTLGCDMVRLAKSEVVRDPDGTIWSNRYGSDGAPPAIFDMMWRSTRGDYTGGMDHWVEGGWNAPSLVRNNTGVTLHGQPREAGLETKNAHFLTPETGSTTHYFWAIARHFDLDNPVLDQQIREGTEYAFVHEDEVMLHGIQQAMGDGDFWAMRPALMPSDAGAVSLRRTLDKMIAEERGEAPMESIAAE